MLKSVAGKTAGVPNTPESFPATVLGFSFEIVKINFTPF
jgi:hypothetical protein